MSAYICMMREMTKVESGNWDILICFRASLFQKTVLDNQTIQVYSTFGN